MIIVKLVLGKGDGSSPGDLTSEEIFNTQAEADAYIAALPQTPNLKVSQEEV